jgi:hypothetical protein
MSKTTQRWKARIGSLKGLGVLILIGVVVLLISIGQDAWIALGTSSQAEAVTIDALVTAGGSGTAHVSLTGTAYYEVGYEETEDGRVVSSFYLLLNDLTGAGVIVKAPTAQLGDRTSGPVELSGLIRDTPSGLRAVIEEDLPYFAAQGVDVDPSFYLAEGARPMDPLLAAGVLLSSAALGGLSLVPLFFPTAVFTPRPIETLPAGPASRARRRGILATGRFQQVKQLEPTIEIGKRRQRFTGAVANLRGLPDGRLMVYIHHVVRTRLYGVVTVHKQESDWGVFVSRSEPWQIEPGVLYGWHDRPAIRFSKQEMGGKPEAVIVSFDEATEQADFVGKLRSAGFPVGTGMGF